MKRFALFLGLLLVSSLASAQVIWVRWPAASNLPTCAIGNKGWVYEISDAVAADDCTNSRATGNSRKVSVCICVWTAGTSAYAYQPFLGAGAGGSPGGSDTQVQYNDGGSFGGDAGLTFNETTNVLTATGGFSGPLPAPYGPSTGAPSTSGTLALWLAADDSSLADSGINGKGVWRWHDRSGNGRDAYQLDATLRPSVALASQNGLSGFLLPAGGHFLGGPGPGTVSAGSVYVVIKPGTVGANNRIFSLSSYASPTSDYNVGIAALLVDGGAATTMRAFRTSLGNDLDIAGGTLGTSAALFVLRWGAGSAALRKNNDSETADTYTDYSFSADLFSIGAGPTGGEAMSGTATFYEVLWYTSKLSDGDDTTVRAYINSKWALW